MKSIIIAALALIVSATAFGQTKPDTSKKVTPEPKFSFDTNKSFTITISYNELAHLVQTSNSGLLPFLKTTDLQVKQLDAVQKYHDDLVQKIISEYKTYFDAEYAKFKSDSIASVKKQIKK